MPLRVLRPPLATMLLAHRRGGRSILDGLLLVGVLAVLATIATPAAAGRVIELETRRVTTPDVAVSPDGKRLAFSMLGHLFLLPAGGGTAEQLTSGIAFDSEPTFSRPA